MKLIESFFAVIIFASPVIASMAVRAFTKWRSHLAFSLVAAAVLLLLIAYATWLALGNSNGEGQMAAAITGVITLVAAVAYAITYTALFVWPGLMKTARPTS